MIHGARSAPNVTHRREGICSIALSQDSHSLVIQAYKRLFPATTEDSRVSAPQSKQVPPSTRYCEGRQLSVHAHDKSTTVLTDCPEKQYWRHKPHRPQICGKGLTSYERCIVRKKERHELRHVLRLSISTENIRELRRRHNGISKENLQETSFVCPTELLHVPRGCPFNFEWYSSSPCTAQ